MTSQKPAPGFDKPASVAILLACLGLATQVYYNMTIGRPRVGDTAAQFPGLLSGVALVLLLAFGLWRRNWSSTPLRALTAPFLGALTGLIILCMPVMLVTKMEFNRPAGKTQILSVALLPGPASLSGKVVISNSSVQNGKPTVETGDALMGEGWMAVQMDNQRPNYWLWLALAVAPLLGLPFVQKSASA